MHIKPTLGKAALSELIFLASEKDSNSFVSETFKGDNCQNCFCLQSDKIIFGIYDFCTAIFMSNTVFDLITALCTKVFQNYWENL